MFFLYSLISPMVFSTKLAYVVTRKPILYLYQFYNFMKVHVHWYICYVYDQLPYNLAA